VPAKCRTVNPQKIYTLSNRGIGIRFSGIYADIQHMNDMSNFAIILGVISDVRLLAACIIVLLYLNFVFYVARYKERNKTPRRRVIVRSKPKEETPAENGENTSAESGNAEE